MDCRPGKFRMAAVKPCSAGAVVYPLIDLPGAERLHPILDELVFTLRLTGWQASPAFDLALERLAQRAGKQWDRISRWMVFREQIQPFLQFSQMAILAALLYLVIEGIPAFTTRLAKL